MAPHPLAFAAVAALVLAGCATPASTLDPAAPAPSDAAGKPPSGAAGPAPSGATGQPPSSTGPAPSSATRPPPSPGPGPQQAGPAPGEKATEARLEVSDQGHLPPGALYVPIVGHVSPAGPPLGQERWFRHDVAEEVLGANLTLEWTPGIGTERLQLVFTPIGEDASGNEYYEPGTRSVVGTSPLRLDVDGLGWNMGKYAVTVWWDNETPGAAAEAVDFQVTGAIRHRVAG